MQQAYSIHTPAFPRAIRLTRADPWPTMATLRAQFAYSCRPARPFPAADFKYATPGLYCRLRDRAMLVKRQQVIQAPKATPKRQRGWFERLLDKLIAKRQTFHVKQSAEQPKPQDGGFLL